MAAKTKKRPAREPYTAADIKVLKAHSKSRTPVSKVAKLMKRSERLLRQKALFLGIGFRHHDSSGFMDRTAALS